MCVLQHLRCNNPNITKILIEQENKQESNYNY